jgi:hypothetical protein
MGEEVWGNVGEVNGLKLKRKIKGVERKCGIM